MLDQQTACRFGLIAGLGVGAGIFYYRSLVKAHLATGLSPSLLMVHADVRCALNDSGLPFYPNRVQPNQAAVCLFSFDDNFAHVEV